MSDLAVGVSTRDRVVVVNGVIPDMPCACCLEVDGEGQMWVTHEQNCIAY